MALFIDINYSTTLCKLTVTVADMANGGQPGTITLVTDNGANQTMPVAKVTSTPANVDFNSPKDGLIHQFTATLTVGNASTSLTQYIPVCAAAPAASDAGQDEADKEKTDDTKEEKPEEDTASEQQEADA